jgi:hypothetical protein
MNTRRVLGFVLILLAALMLMAPAARAQSGSCVDCHFADPAAPEREHLGDWERSAHGRAGVGCEKCHGGDAASYDAALAHRGIRHSGNAASRVHRRSLPATCGTCHPGPFVHFQKSRHYALLRSGDNRVPTCATCHGAVASALPSPKILEAECQRCHGPKATAPRVDRAGSTRVLIEGVNESRRMLMTARPLIDRVNDPARQAQLREAYDQAEIPLIEAGRSVHEFVFDNLVERLATARRRLDALLAALANPEGAAP